MLACFLLLPALVPSAFVTSSGLSAWPMLPPSSRCHRPYALAPSASSFSRSPPSPFQRAPPAAMDQAMDNMRRADTPSDEEERTLQIICGGIGVVLGPRLVGSSLVGLVLGAATATALANAGGRTGLWAREIGWQAAQFADKQSFAQLGRTSRRKAGELFRAGLTQMQMFANLDTVSDMRRRAAAQIVQSWSIVRGWADSCGLSTRLVALWNASRVGDFLELCANNIEQRQEAMQQA
jgi:hypothetical protein